ncbi:macrophage mannose receptor 1-like [Menidia menidia]
MDLFMTLIIVLSSGLTLSSCSQPPPRQYHYVSTPKNWTEARQFCREKYTDLATFDNMDDISRLKADFSYSLAWIGLWDDPENWKTSMGSDTNSWRWSATGETSRTGYQSWEYGRPIYTDEKNLCVLIHSDTSWHDYTCKTTEKFICYNVSENNKKNYFHIPTKKTWQSAQQYCRENFTDLAMIENEAENTEAIRGKPDTGYYWIGLYRNPWTWSDRSQSSFWEWHPSFKFSNGQHCFAENTDHEWVPNSCGAKLPFICHQVLRRNTVFRMTTETDVDLSDPDIQSQVLQKMEALLRSRGLTDFKLRWKLQPRKKDKDQCAKQECDTGV